MNPKAAERIVPIEGAKPDWLEVVRTKVESLRFGSIQIIVHDGRVTQIEALEKTRFNSPRDEQGPQS
ncbi:MAG: YezD family protein [Luteolibacter sp.]